MSNRPCNFCALKALRASVRGTKEKIVLLQEDSGIAAYKVLPRTRLSNKTRAEREPYFCAWFAELTNKCVC